MKFELRDAVLPLLIVNIITFVVQQLVPGFTEMFLLVSSDVLHRPWILLTSMFLHADPWHLLFNMYALFIFGPLIQMRIGTKRFLLIYFLSGIMAALAAIFFYPSALGASGAIMGILGVTIMILPDLKVLFFFVIPMSMRTAGIIFAIIDLIGVFNPYSKIANAAHLAGLGCGVLYGYLLVRQRDAFQKTFVQVKKKKPSKNIDMDEDEIEQYLEHGRL